ncbi:MAG: hypothetical protein JSR77_04040 [Planctomycetes bacterium]|nr:hypothetical protein [Planctomycetota bacterium]
MSSSSNTVLCLKGLALAGVLFGCAQEPRSASPESVNTGLAALSANKGLDLHLDSIPDLSDASKPLSPDQAKALAERDAIDIDAVMQRALAKNQQSPAVPPPEPSNAVPNSGLAMVGSGSPSAEPTPAPPPAAPLPDPLILAAKAQAEWSAFAAAAPKPVDEPKPAPVPAKPKVEAPAPPEAKPASSSNLRVARAVLCTKVMGFGKYNPYSSTTFSAGRAVPAIIYVEIENFASRPARDGDPTIADAALSELSSVELSQSLTLYQDPSGLQAWHHPSQSVIETSRGQRRDFYLIQQVELPRTLSIGRYNLKVTVKDKTSGQESEAMIPVTIVAGR